MFGEKYSSAITDYAVHRNVDNVGFLRIYKQIRIKKFDLVWIVGVIVLGQLGLNQAGLSNQEFLPGITYDPWLMIISDVVLVLLLSFYYYIRPEGDIEYVLRSYTQPKFFFALSCGDVAWKPQPAVKDTVLSRSSEKMRRAQQIRRVWLPWH